MRPPPPRRNKWGRVPVVTNRRAQPVKAPKKNDLLGVGPWGVRPRSMPAPKGTAPTAPTAPGAAQVTSSAAQTGGVARTPADARDPQYFNDLAKLEQHYIQRKADLAAAGEGAKRSFDRSMSDLGTQQPKDVLQTQQGSNKAGLLYSGFLSKGLGDIETSYAKRRTELSEDLAADDRDRTRQLGELESLYGPSGLNRNDIILGAMERASARDLEYPGHEVPGAASVVSSGAKPYTTVAGTSKSGQRGVWHIYPNG